MTDPRILHALDAAREALDAAHRHTIDAAERAEVDPAKTDNKVQRLGYMADEWLKFAAVASELLDDAPPPAGTPL